MTATIKVGGVLLVALLCWGCTPTEESTCQIDRSGPGGAVRSVSGDCGGQDFSGTDLSGADVSGVRWGDATCPDGTSSDEHGGTCEGHLDPQQDRPDLMEDQAEPPEDLPQEEDLPQGDLPPDQGSPPDVNPDLDELEDLEEPEDLEEVDACSLSCEPRPARCEGSVRVYDDGAGTAGPDCTCDFSQVQRRQECLGQGLWCVQGQCGLPRGLEGFVRIEPGSFTMGSSPNDPLHVANEGQVEVTLTQAFFFQQTEVTRGQYEAVMGDVAPGEDCGPRCPVSRLEWRDAINFANGLSVLHGLEPCYNTDQEVPVPQLPMANPYLCEGYRLPTEAEWEHVCRTTQGPRTLCEGEACQEVAWFRVNASSSLHPVASLNPSSAGIYDLGGNVLEWTHDGYTDQAPGGEDPFVNAVHPGAPVFERIMRGGHYSSPQDELRCAKRYAIYTGQIFGGLRLARSARQP